MPDDIDWENACNDFHPDFVLVRSVGQTAEVTPIKPRHLRQLKFRRKQLVARLLSRIMQANELARLPARHSSLGTTKLLARRARWLG